MTHLELVKKWQDKALEEYASSLTTLERARLVLFIRQAMNAAAGRKDV